MASGASILTVKELNDMTKQELENKLKRLNQEFEEKRLLVYQQYAQENNPVKVGDIIQDHIGKGVVTRIEVYFGWCDVPECKYMVEILNKDGSKTKRAEKERWVFQSNIKIINGNDIL